MSAKKKKAKQNSNLPLMIGTVVILCLAAAVMVFPKGGGERGTSAAADETEAQVIGEGESLVIPADQVTSAAQFYPIEVDGTRMEVLAVRDSDGNIRTAFNTCQICYSSGRGYYVQDGDVLVCQNCGNRFTIDQVEVQTGGCNPWPIFAENKTVTDDEIEISYDFLQESEKIFSNWKTSY